jgi:hypothetical protein
MAADTSRESPAWPAPRAKEAVDTRTPVDEQGRMSGLALPGEVESSVC